MADETLDRRPCDPQDLREAVRIHTKKITDSCRDKDCVEDLRVFFTCDDQAVINSASSVKARCAELLYASLEVEPISFNRNHYCIDITFYYRIIVDAIHCGNRPVTVRGLAVFSKRAVLCGEDSRAKVFSSDPQVQPTIYSAGLPVAVVEVLDPMILGSRVREGCDPAPYEALPSPIPEIVQEQFEGPLTAPGEGRRVYVTLGQFSLIRLERDAQLLIPTFEYRLPKKECCVDPGCAEDPCELFSRIAFPEEQFFPKGCENCPEQPVQPYGCD